jgi:AraC-like DNA-binding protein
MKLGDLSVGYLYSLQAALRAEGVDPEPLFTRFRVDEALLARSQARISIPRLMRMGNAAIQVSQNQALGLAMGQHSQPSHLGLPGMAAQCAPDLRSAFATLVRFERLTSQNYRGHSSLVGDALRFYSISPYNAFNLFVVDSALSSRVHLAARMTGGRARPSEIHIEFPEPEYGERYAAYFDCPVLFEQAHNQIIWSAESLAAPLIERAATTHAQLVALCEMQLHDLRRQRSLRERVEEAISPQLHSGVPTLAEVARRLGLPSWTLRRRLQAEEQIRFQDIIDEARRALALSYIRDTEIALGEIAFLLGFSSPEAFQRAFRRWIGMPPGQFRRALRTNTPASQVWQESHNIEEFSEERLPVQGSS